jgi:tetratricopeptide (TPR) repeat protein
MLFFALLPVEFASSDMNEILFHRTLDRAHQYMEDGKLLHAVQLYWRLIGSDPSLGEPYVEIARVYIEWDRFDEAERILLRGLRSASTDCGILLMMGNLQLRQHRYARAVLFYRRLRNLRIPHVHFNMGIAFLHMGDLSNAEKEVRLTILCNPRFPRAHEVLGEILLRRHHYSESVRELQNGLRSDPYSALGHRLLGVAFSRLSDWEKAYDEFVLAIDMDPRSALSWQLCGDALLHLGRPAEAEPYLKKALTLDPRSADAFTSIGFLCLARGDTVRAIEALDWALHAGLASSRPTRGRFRLTGQGKRRLS